MIRSTALVILAVLVTAGCKKSEATTSSGKPPQLWSSHKQLDVPVDVCAAKALDALKSLGFTGVAQNGDFAYGNSFENRAAVKCVALASGSFVYFAVAGPDKEIVETLRNQIAKKL